MHQFGSLCRTYKSNWAEIHKDIQIYYNIAYAKKASIDCQRCSQFRHTWILTEIPFAGFVIQDMPTGKQSAKDLSEGHPHGNCDVSGCRCSVLHDLPWRASARELRCIRMQVLSSPWSSTKGFHTGTAGWHKRQKKIYFSLGILLVSCAAFAGKHSTLSN